MAEELEPHILERFNIIQRLGKGAYGVVWKAVDKKSKKQVALKKVFDAFHNSTDAQRTFREVMFLKELRQHENSQQQPKSMNDGRQLGLPATLNVG